MPENSNLAEYQDALVELLTSGQSEEAICNALLMDPRFAAYKDYLSQLDPDMIAVASELLSRWSKFKDAE